MNAVVNAILLAASLCADCFAVSICSGVTIRNAKTSEILKVAAAFAVIQTLLLFSGWAFGSFFVGMIEKVAHIIGFLLLLYVGGSMLLEAIKGEAEVKDLNGWKNVVLGGVATSIDALAVGVSQSLAGYGISEVTPLLISVFVITAASVIVGLLGGKTIGQKAGRWAEIVGGAVLIGIGIGILL